MIINNIGGLTLMAKWTTQEDEILKQVYDKMSYPEIVEKYFPERTVPSVRGRIKTLGI